MKKAKPGIEAKIAAAALRLAARQVWGRLTLDQVARDAKIPTARAQKHFAGKDDILPAIVRLIDAKTAASIGKPDPDASPHDRMFEVMMARMDALQEHRRAICGIMDEVRRNPSLLRRLVPAQIQAMRRMLALAGLKPEGGKEALAVAGLSGIYGLTLFCWRSDHSPDMAKTMAALDLYLRRIAPVAEIIFRPLP